MFFLKENDVQMKQNKQISKLSEINSFFCFFLLWVKWIYPSTFCQVTPNRRGQFTRGAHQHNSWGPVWLKGNHWDSTLTCIVFTVRDISFILGVFLEENRESTATWDYFSRHWSGAAIPYHTMIFRISFWWSNRLTCLWYYTYKYVCIDL